MKKTKLYIKASKNDSLVKISNFLLEAHTIAKETFKDRNDNRVYIPDDLHKNCMIQIGMQIEPTSHQGKIIDNKVISIWHDSNTLAYVLRPETFKEQDEIDLENYRKSQIAKEQESIAKYVEEMNQL